MNLKLIHNPTGNVLFAHNGLWLHPLLGLIRNLNNCHYDLEQCTLYDKVVGRAAALLVAKIAVPHISAQVLSARAIPVLVRYHICFEHHTLVAQLSCATERLLHKEWDIHNAYNIILRLANS